VAETVIARVAQRALRPRLRFEVTPKTAAPLFDEEVEGFARLVDVANDVVIGEFRFEADCEFVDLVVKATEMTIYLDHRGRGYAKRFLREFFRYLRREALHRDEEIIVNGEITSKTILHIWRSTADRLLFDTKTHDHTRRATDILLTNARELGTRKRASLVAALPDLAPQDERGFLKKPCALIVGIASLIEPIEPEA
jgi:GNAT superfamily N-acetyltransferase